MNQPQHRRCEGSGARPLRGSISGPFATGRRYGECPVCGRNLALLANVALMVPHVDYDRRIT